MTRNNKIYITYFFLHLCTVAVVVALACKIDGVFSSTFGNHAIHHPLMTTTRAAYTLFIYPPTPTSILHVLPYLLTRSSNYFFHRFQGNKLNCPLKNILCTVCWHLFLVMFSLFVHLFPDTSFSVDNDTALQYQIIQPTLLTKNAGEKRVVSLKRVKKKQKAIIYLIFLFLRFISFLQRSANLLDTFLVVLTYSQLGVCNMICFGCGYIFPIIIL